MKPLNLSTYFFEDDGRIPNNPTLPVLLYAGVFKQDPRQAETRFALNEWSNNWVNGIYTYHHYHSNSHEVLAILEGSALLMIGGKNGKEIEVQAGDVLVLPAGTAHKLLRKEAGFSVLGAYPGGTGTGYNTKTGKDGERPQVLEDIKRVPLPEQDPVYGHDGPLREHWYAK